VQGDPLCALLELGRQNTWQLGKPSNYIRRWPPCPPSRPLYVPCNNARQLLLTVLYGVRTILVRSIPHASARLTRDDQEKAMFGTGCGPPCRTQESSGLLGVGGSWAVGMKYSTVLYFANRMPLEASCISQYEVFFAIHDYAGGWSWRLFFSRLLGIRLVSSHRRPPVGTSLARPSPRKKREPGSRINVQGTTQMS